MCAGGRKFKHKKWIWRNQINLIATKQFIIILISNEYLHTNLFISNEYFGIIYFPNCFNRFFLQKRGSKDS
jgi:hypothetical protein